MATPSRKPEQKLIAAKPALLMIEADPYGRSPIAEMLSYHISMVEWQIFEARIKKLQALFTKAFF